MRFVVVGAGAVGGVIGGRLFQSGQQVILVARGEHYARLAGDGLRLATPDQSVWLPIPALPDASLVDYRPDDVVILAVKSQHTLPAVRSVSRSAPPDLTVVCAQNGVDNERTALRWFRWVYGMCVMCPAAHLAPGVVQAHSSPTTGLLDVGRWPSGMDDRAVAIARALASATFDSRPRPDIARWKWGKLLMNVGNVVEAVCGPSARGGELLRRVRHEALDCFAATGIDYVGEEEDAARRGDLLTLRPADGRPRPGGSSWQSLARQTGSIETDYLNGEIVLLGRQHGVPTPTNELLQRVANRLAAEHRPPGSVPEAELLCQLG